MSMDDSEILDVFDEEADDENLEIVTEEEEEEPELPIPSIKVTVSRDKLYAYLTIAQAPPEPYQITVDQIFDIMAKSKVEYGVMMDKIELIVANQEYPTEELIAVGQEFVPGIDGRLEYMFSAAMGKRPKDMGHYVDHYDLNLVKNVEAGQLLVQKIPVQQGEPGMSVYGQPLRPPRVRDVRLPVGKGTEISKENPNELLAQTDGFVRLDTRSFNRVVVEDIFQVRGDVDLSTGNLDIEGSVDISGTVREGFEVKATGNIKISGVMEAGNLGAGGSIEVVGGVVGGKNGAILKAENDIVVKFADNANMTAGGNISVADEVFNCDLLADKTITVGSRQQGKLVGAIIGGSVSAGKEIKVMSVGTDAGILTRLRVGEKPGLVIRKRNMQMDIKNLKDRLGEQKIVIKSLLERKEAREPAIEGRAAQKTAIEQKQAEIYQHMQGILFQAEKEGLVTSQHAVEVLENQITETRNTLTRVESSIDTLNQRIAVKGSIGEMMQNKKTLSQFQSARDNLVSKLTELEGQLAQRTANPWEKLPWATRREVEQLQGHLKNIKAQIGAIEAEDATDQKIADALNQMQTKQAELKLDLVNLQEELKNVNKELDELSQHIPRIVVSDKLWSGTEVIIRNRRRRFTRSRSGVKLQLSENDAVIARNLV